MKRGRLLKYGYQGSPDIIAVIGGVFVGIEIKDTGNKQSQEQKDFQKYLESAGGVYILVYSVEQLMKDLKKKTLI